MIGIYDSGLGGLSVLREVRLAMPTADLVYVADQARAPYGDRPLPEVLSFAKEIAALLWDRGATTTVLASNTISNAALHELRAEYPDRVFVGLEPAVKPAVALTTTGTIAVLATTATINGPLLGSMVRMHAEGVEVIGVSLPGLVEMVEDGLAASPEADALLRTRLAPALERRADVFVLACTHYPFAREALGRVIGDATIVDPAEAVARQIARVHKAAGTGTLVAVTSGDPVRFRMQAAEVAPEVRFDSVEHYAPHSHLRFPGPH